MTSAVFSIGDGNAKAAGAAPGADCPKVGPTHRALVQAIRNLQPVKPWAFLANVLDLMPRTARHRIEKTREFSIEEIAALLHSEHGFYFLTAVMADAKPKWWRMCSVFMETAELQRAQIAQRRKLAKVMQGALDADRQLAEAIGYAQAVSVSDPDFLGPHVDGLRASAGASHRAVATAAKRGGR